MEPLDKDQLSEQELDGMLREWTARVAPARLRAAIFEASRLPWWRRLWTTSIRVPLPAAACLLMFLAAAGWRWGRPSEPRVVVRTERVVVPVVRERVVTKTVYRDQIVQVPVARDRAANKLLPVAELRPRIIRSEHAQN